MTLYPLPGTRALVAATSNLSHLGGSDLSSHSEAAGGHHCPGLHVDPGGAVGAASEAPTLGPGRDLFQVSLVRVDGKAFQEGALPDESPVSDCTCV